MSATASPSVALASPNSPTPRVALPGAMPMRTLGRTELVLSAIGFGASPLGGAFGEIDAAEGARAVPFALDHGITYFDVSPYYGNTLAEERLGAALDGAREDVTLSTKCGRYGVAEFDFTAERITREFEHSLRRLRTDHVDLLLAHDIEFAPPGLIVAETLPAMRRLQQAGKVRYIGISGYPLAELTRTVEAAELDAVLSYCHFNLLADDLDVRLSAAAAERQVGLINASPLHMGILAGLPVPEWHPAAAAVRAAGPVFAELCRGFGLAPATVALRFCLEHATVASTLVGMASREQVRQSLAALELNVPHELARQVEGLLGPLRNQTWPSGREDANR